MTKKICIAIALVGLFAAECFYARISKIGGVAILILWISVYYIRQFGDDDTQSKNQF